MNGSQGRRWIPLLPCLVVQHCTTADADERQHILTQAGFSTALAEPLHALLGLGGRIRPVNPKVRCRMETKGTSAPLLPRSARTTRTKANYDRLACCYDAWASWERPYVSAGFDMLAVQEGEDYLEIGVGTGKLLARAGAASASGACVGIDLSPRMCKRARRLCESELGESQVVAAVVDTVAEDPTRRVQVVCGDAFRLLREMVDARVMGFDAVAVCFTLELFDERDMNTLLGQVHRLISPRDNGRVVLVAMSKAAEGGCAMACYRCIRACCPCVVDCKPIDVAGLVAGVDGLEVTQRSVLPMYGLAVELLEVRCVV